MATDIEDLEGQRNSLNRAALYGDPNRVQRVDVMKNIAAKLEEKRKESATLQMRWNEHTSRAS